MGRPRSTDDKLPRGLYVKHGKNTDTYFTIIQGKYTGLGNELKQAERNLRELIGEPIIPQTIGELAERFIEHLEQQLRDQVREALSPRTVADYTEALRKKLMPFFGKMKPTSFKPMHAAQYLARPENAKRRVRANRDLAALGSMFAYGMSLGAVESNPCRGVKRNREFARNRRVTIAEMNAFLKVAEAEGPGYAMVAWIGAMVGITGRRRAEILMLHKSNITDRGLVVKESKIKPGGVARIFEIPWTPLVLEIATKAQARVLRDKTATMFIFPTRDGTPYTDKGFKAMWNRAMVKYVEKGGVWFTAHDLRALYVTETLARGDSPNTHQNEETMRRVYDRKTKVPVKPLA